MPVTKITMERIGEPFHFEARSAAGNTVHIDAGAAIGGTGKGARPMELLLMGLAGCSGIDVVTILRKQRQNISAMRVEVEGERGESQEANPFQKIKVIFALAGEIDENHLKRAIELSMDKYCSVAKLCHYSTTSEVILFLESSSEASLSFP